MFHILLMKSCTFYLFLLGLFPTLYAQSYRPTAEREFTSLTGTIYLVPFFIDTHTDRWTSDEVDQYMADLKDSEDWIVEQAAAYDVHVRFPDDLLSSKDEEILIDSTKTNIRNSSLLLQATMEQLGFLKYEDYLAYHGHDPSKQKICTLFFLKNQSSTHAMDFHGNQSLSALDCSFRFFKGSSGLPLHSTLISHEFLHLFGAWDLYYENGKMPQNLATKAAQLYPNSIMRTGRCLNPNIDELTAWRIGWNYTYQEVFQEFAPKPRMRLDGTRIHLDLKKKNPDETKETGD